MAAKPPKSKRFARLSPELRLQLALRLREIVDKAKEVPCADCGNWYARKFGSQMTFDHLNPNKKLFNIGTVGVSDSNDLGFNLVTPKVLREEIAKCDVVCRACHDKREARRAKELIASRIAAEQRETLEAWEALGEAATIGHVLWVRSFGFFGRIVAFAYEREQEAMRSRGRAREWETVWTSAIGNVIRMCSRGFMGQVFEPPKVAAWPLSLAKKDFNAWKKLVNFVPQPWKSDRGGST